MNRGTEVGSRRSVTSGVGLLLAAALLAALVFATRAASEAPAQCRGGTPKEVELGIVKASGCWTISTTDGATVYTGRWEDQVEGIDLNGFVLTGETGAGLRIDTGTRHVSGISLVRGASATVQLNSRNWPIAGEIRNLGNPIKLEFVAPDEGDLLIEDLHFGSNTVARALAGLSPVGDVETPIRLEEDGRGSMDLAISLGGAFTLKGHPQSLTIALPTELGKGTTLDGFELELEEIDSFRVLRVNNLQATYSAARHLIAGSATAALPFTTIGKRAYGFGIGFALENGALNHVSFDVRGVHFPIGEPPGGFLTGFGGGLTLRAHRDLTSDILLDAHAMAELGPEVPTPWGKVAPVEVDAAMTLGLQRREFLFEIRGGVKIFRIQAGDVYLAIHTSSGVEFGVGIGVGFPSYRNNENDPFYIGTRVDGWFGKGKFQLEGRGRVALFSLKIFDGQILVNDRAAGACWRVLGVPGGAVYPYGAPKVKTFGIGCGLDAYREKFPGGARISAGRSQVIHLTPEERIVSIRGLGGAPGFVMRSGRRVVRTPVDVNASIRRRGLRHAIFVDEASATTHVVLPRPTGNWTITPYADSPAIVSAQAGREVPRERVTAEVTGRGPVRTLRWDSLDRAHTRLVFMERLPDGRDVPLFETDRPRGARQFRAVTGAHYGRRRIRVLVVHGYGSRQAGIVERYRVATPRRLAGPGRVAAWRDDHDVHVRWSGVRAAHGYLVQVLIRRRGKPVTSFVRRVAPRRRSLLIPHHPGGGRAIARVYTLNRDGRVGAPNSDAFLLNPVTGSLPRAARLAAGSATRRNHSIMVRSRCPIGPHCQVVAELRSQGRLLTRVRYQQTPDTFHFLRLTPALRIDRQAVLNGSPIRAVVRIHRAGNRVRGLAAVEP